MLAAKADFKAEPTALIRLTRNAILCLLHTTLKTTSDVMSDTTILTKSR